MCTDGTLRFMREDWETGGVYHVYNRGVDGRRTFDDDHDRDRFIGVLEHHRIPKAVPYSRLKRLRSRFIPSTERAAQALVEVLCLCLMPNHFHLLLRQLVDGGISKYAQLFLNSYTRYYNTRHGRKGPLFSGKFHAVHIETDEQLLHVSRYIHLNPVVAGLADDAFGYPWSSASAYASSPGRTPLWSATTGVPITTTLIHSMFPPMEYEKFVRDHIAYARELAHIKHLLLEEEIETAPTATVQPRRLTRLATFEVDQTN